MGFQEPWILADDIHDVAGNHGFVVFTTNHLGESKQFLDEIHQEAFFCFFVCISQNGLHGEILIVPAIDPTAQHKVFKFVQDHSEPSTWRCNLSVMITSVSITSSLVKAFKHSCRLR